ncbi:MAG: VOC family protein [Pseudacidovorax sp.]|uniref:VOC family protein n=1 Tax=Pseudacidovorax sp. TaxID=1934311 RepID=UPI001B66F36D|nr:VOC family protein [Pseudacidovorax sp.]MBP6893130.1 VOC family protein [Pseudacidovorax sp.]
MQFAYAIFYVQDVAATLDFYERAFAQRRRFLSPQGDYGELDTGGTALAFASLGLMRSLGKSPRPAEPSAPSGEIAFTTTDVPAAVERALAAGASLVRAPQTMPWGQTIAYVHDADGVLVELCTPVAPPSPDQPYHVHCPGLSPRASR